MGQRWRTPLSTWIKYKNLTAKSLEWWLVRGNYANMCNMTWFYRWIRKTWSRFIQIPRSFLILAIFVAQSMKISRCHITSPEKKNHPMVKSLEFDEFDQGLGTIEMRRGQTWPHQQLSWPQRLGILENGWREELPLVIFGLKFVRTGEFIMFIMIISW